MRKFFSFPVIFIFCFICFSCGESTENKNGRVDTEETQDNDQGSDESKGNSESSLSEKERVIEYLENYYDWLKNDVSADMMVNKPVEASRRIAGIHKKAGFKTQSELEKALQKYMTEPDVYELTTKIAERSMEIFKNVSK